MSTKHPQLLFEAKLMKSISGSKKKIKIKKIKQKEYQICIGLASLGNTAQW